MDIKIDADLVDTVSRGELDEWQAMSVQTCRDAAFARAEVDDIKKKIEALRSDLENDPCPPTQTSPIHLIPRGC